MAKLLDPREPVRFTPEDQAGLDAPIVYLLKVPTEWDRINLRKALAARGARQAGWIGLAEAMREVLEQAGAGAPLETVDSFLSLARAWSDLPQPTTEEGQAAATQAFAGVREAWLALKPVVDACADASPSFAALRGDDAVYLHLYSIEAARIFVKGWEGPGLPPFANSYTGVPVDLLGRLPPSHVFAIATEVNRMLRPTETEAGNSVSPSPGVSGPTSSTTAPLPAAAAPGTSPASAGPTS